MRFGGSYYENSVHNKGPLEPGLYHLAAMVTSFDSFWFAISAMVIGGSLLIGFACRRVVTLFDGEPWLGWAAVAIGFIHLALSGADYAGVLYSRNMTTTLLCAAFLLLTGPGAERGSTRRKAACLVGGGACLGLAVQTLQPTLLSAMVIVAIGLFVVGRTQLVVARREVPARALLAGAMLLSFLSAPVWYLLRGSWGPFWDGWWVYGRYMSSALGRGVTEQMGLGWHQFYVYSQTHAPAHLCVVGFVMLGAARWPQLGRAQRRLQVLLPLWWLAGWGEVILTQRYSSHYFVVTTVPLMLLCAGLAAHVVAMLRAGGASVADRHLVPYLLVLMSLVWTGFGPLRSGVEAASSFQGVHHMAMQREQGRDGTARGAGGARPRVAARRPDAHLDQLPVAVPRLPSCVGHSLHLEVVPDGRDLPRAHQPRVRIARELGSVGRRCACHPAPHVPHRRHVPDTSRDACGRPAGDRLRADVHHPHVVVGAPQ